MKLVSYTIPWPRAESLDLVHLSDLHGRDPKNALALIRELSPKLILATGDMTENATEFSVSESFNRRGAEFLAACTELGPVYYSLGNHEGGMWAENRSFYESAGVTLLDNEVVTLPGDIHLGGWTSGYVRGVHPRGKYQGIGPDLAFLRRFSALKGYKILLCHHPEYYPAHIRETGVDLTLSGHAHGGQWKLFGRSIYAPGQGLFPKYAAGLHENRLIVSCGMTNTVIFPRFFNPPELVYIRLVPMGEAKG